MEKVVNCLANICGADVELLGDFLNVSTVHGFSPRTLLVV